MKKLLSVLGTFVVASSTLSSVAACSTPRQENKYSDEVIDNALIDILENDGKKINFSNEENISQNKIIEKLNADIPSSILIKNIVADNYQSSKVSFKIDSVDKNTKYNNNDKVKIYVNYGSVQDKDTNEFILTIVSNFDNDDKDIPDAIVQNISAKISNIQITNYITEKDLINKVSENIPDKSLINSKDENNFANYLASKVKIAICSSRKKDPLKYKDGDKVSFSVSYDKYNSKNTINLAIVDKNNEAVRNYIQNTKVIQLPINPLDKDTASKEINAVFKANIPNAANFEMINSANFVAMKENNNDGSFTNGSLQFDVKNLTTGDKINSATFSLQFSTKEEQNFVNADKKFNDPNVEKTLWLQKIPLSSFVPATFYSHFSDKTQSSINRLLEKTTLGTFVDDFLNPNGKYANLLPNVMPVITNNSIDADRSGPNKQLWIFLDRINDDLIHDYQISRDDLNTTKDFVISQKYNSELDISFSLYNILKNVMPDLIHFHNYLLKIKGPVNYLLEFIKYLTTDKAKMSAIIKDGFDTINSDISKIKTNFDNLFHDFLEPFTTNSGNSGLAKLLSLTVNMLGISKVSLNFDHFTKNGNPTDELLLGPLNKILSNPKGQDVKTPLSLTIQITFTFVIKDWTLDVNEDIDLNSLHINELKTLISNVFKILNFDDNNYEITSGKLFIQGQEKGSTEWKDLHSIKDILNSTNLRFELRNLNFKITSKNDSNLYLVEKDKTIDLEL